MILTCPQCATRYEVDAAKFSPQGRSVRCAKCGNVWSHKRAVSEIAPPADMPPATAAPDAGQGSTRAGPSLPTVGQAAFRRNDVEPPPGDADLSAMETPSAQQSAPAPDLKSAGTTGNAAARPGKPVSAVQRAVADTGWLRTSGGRAKLAAIGAGWAALALLIILIGWAGLHFRRDVASSWPQSASLYRQFGIRVKPRGIRLLMVRNRIETEDGEPVLIVSGLLLNDSNRELSVPQIRVALSDAKRHELYHWPIVPRVPALKPGQSAPFQAKLANPPRGAQDVEVTFYGTDE